MHRRNATERYIITWNNHFVSGLSGTDKLFLVHLWDRLLYQAHIKFNVLRQSRHKLNISAHTMTEENFDLKKHFWYHQAPSS